MAQLKVKASSKPSTQNSKKSNTGPKPTTALGRFNHTFFEGKGVNQSVMMAGMSALGLGGVYSVINPLMPTMRQAGGVSLKAVQSLAGLLGLGKKDKSGNSGDDIGVVSGAVAKNRATEATKGIRTLTKVTKKGFADVLKAMGAAPGQKKKKKTLFEMLTDAITGGGGSGGGGGFTFIGGFGRGFLGRLIKTAGIGLLFNAFLAPIRSLLFGDEHQSTGMRASYFLGDTVVGKRTLNAGSAAYKAHSARKIAQMNKIVAGGRKLRRGATLTKAGIRAASLTAATSASVYTFGLSILLEELVMEGLVAPLIDRYIRSYNKDAELKLFHSLGGNPHKAQYKNLSKEQKDLALTLVGQAGGTMSWASRNMNQFFDWVSYQADSNTHHMDKSTYSNLSLEQQRRLQAFDNLLAQEKDPFKKTLLAKEKGDYIDTIHRSEIGYRTTTDEIAKETAIKRVLNPAAEGVSAYTALANVVQTDASKVNDAFRKSVDPLNIAKKVYTTALVKEADKNINKALEERLNGSFENADYRDTQKAMYDLFGGTISNKIGNRKGYLALKKSEEILKSNNLKSAARVGGLKQDTYENHVNNLVRQFMSTNDLALQQAIYYDLVNVSNSSNQYLANAASMGLTTINNYLGNKKAKQMVTDVYSLYHTGDYKSIKEVTSDQAADVLRDHKDVKRATKFGEHAEADEKAVAEFNKAYNAAQGLDVNKEAAKLQHQDATDLVTIQNQLDYHITQLANILNGTGLASEGQSGNPMEQTSSAAGGGSATTSGGTTLANYFGRIKSMQANYTGEGPVKNALNRLNG